MHVGTYRSALFGPQNLKKSLPKYTIEDRKVLEKRVHVNPKFKSIQPRTDTGFNARKKDVLQREINKYFKITSNETFSRITLSDFIQLIISDSHENNKKVNTLLYQDDGSEAEEMSAEKAKQTVPPCYLLVDVRPPTDFRQSHIVGAVNHEYAKLGRSVNWESQELIRYRNHPEWVIILYDMNENVAADYAATLIHRGYENVFMLSGGMKLAFDKFSSTLVVTNQTSDNAPNDWFTLRNESVPLSVCEQLADQLTEIILPPLSTKGSAAERWYATCGSIAPSEVGTSRSSVNSKHRAPRSKSLVNEKPKAWR